MALRRPAEERLVFQAGQWSRGNVIMLTRACPFVLSPKSQRIRRPCPRIYIKAGSDPVVFLPHMEHPCSAVAHDNTTPGPSNTRTDVAEEIGRNLG